MAVYLCDHSAYIDPSLLLVNVPVCVDWLLVKKDVLSLVKHDSSFPMRELWASLSNEA